MWKPKSKSTCVLVLLALLGACGDDADPGASTTPGVAQGPGQPLYLLTTLISVPGNTSTTLVGTVHSLEPGLREPANAIERPGWALLHASPVMPGSFFLNDQVEEPRCGGLRNIFGTSGGDIYAAATDGFFATCRRLFGAQAGTEPCLVRGRQS